MRLGILLLAIAILMAFTTAALMLLTGAEFINRLTHLL